MKLRALPIWLTVFVLSLVVAVSCTRPPTPTPTPSPAGPVRIGYSASPGGLPWSVSEAARLFKANNVNVDLQWFTGYLDSVSALAAGQLDANTQTLSDTIYSVAAGADQVIVLVNGNSRGYDTIVASKEINSIADLRGKTVAVEEGSVDHFLLLLGLNQERLTQSDIQFQPLQTKAAAAAFAAGRVDAVGTYGPFTAKALERPGSKELFSSQDFPGAVPTHLVVNRKLIKERPQDVQALVNTWFETLGFMRANQEQADKVMAERAGIAVEAYKRDAAETKIFSVQENLRAFAPATSLTSLPYAARETSQFLIRSGFKRQPLDFNMLFDDRFIRAYADALTNQNQ